MEHLLGLAFIAAGVAIGWTACGMTHAPREQEASIEAVKRFINLVFELDEKHWVWVYRRGDQVIRDETMGYIAAEAVKIPVDTVRVGGPAAGV